MRQKKLRRAEFLSFPNCIQTNPKCQGKWRQFLTRNNDEQASLWVELGCGRGDLAQGLARLFPQALILAIDLKMARMWAGAKAALENGLSNLWYLREDITIAATFIFGIAELDKIWLTFPDPFPKSRHAPRRLTGYDFLKQYRRILKHNGELHFKTDNIELFDFTCKNLYLMDWQPIAITYDLYQSPYLNEETGLQTAYEKRFIAEGKKICYLYLKNPENSHVSLL